MGPDETIPERLREAIEGFVENQDDHGLSRLLVGVRAALDEATLPGAPTVGGDAPEPDAPIARAEPGLVERLRDGERRDRFQELGVLARGGMGVILRVWDDDLRRVLAKKVAGTESLGVVDPLTRARFLEEAQVTGQLDHPGIVPVHDLGVDEEGRLFFLMRLVEGSTLADVFALAREEREGWSLPRALDTLRRAAEAVAYAHSKGVVHRDLKPANVMVGRFGEVYVMDWGLARLLDAADPGTEQDEAEALTPARGAEARLGSDARLEGALRTEAGSVMGTPSYMPPEQARGQIDRIDARSDVYAFGAMLYELLTGWPPYTAPGERAEPLVILTRILEGPPDPLAKVAPGRPPELVAICERAMAREPGKRYADMIELAGELGAFLEGRVVRAYATGPWEELKKWVRRNRALAASLAGAVALAVGGASAVAWVQSDARVRIEKERNVAEARATRLQRFTDILRATELTAAAEGLWPRVPERVPEFEQWLESTDEALANLPLHRAHLASPETPIQELERLEEVTGELEALEVLRREVGQRYEFAKSVVRETVEGPAAAAAWAEAVEEIAASPHYGGLRLEPQVGLRPLGFDSRSGLYEFWDVGTGESPVRREDGSWGLDEASGVVLVLVPGGTYLVGAVRPWSWFSLGLPHVDRLAQPIEGPVESVALDPFFLSKYELTAAQWERMAGTRPSLLQVEVERPGLHPVDGISWDEASLWLSRFGFMLPTAAQREVAFRGGTTTPHWSGSLPGDWRGVAHMAQGVHAHTQVGRYPANPFGFHDLLGNVEEWCRDPYRTAEGRGKPARAEGDGLLLYGPALERFLVGGNYGTTLPGVPYVARASCLGVAQRKQRGPHVGVRPLRVLDGLRRSR